jgi:TolB-like protein
MSEGIEREPPKGAEADWLARLWRRMREHKMVEWSVAYVALAYGIQHGVVLTSESLDWPHEVARVTMILLAVGLPLVVTLAWYQGERASRNFSQAELSILAVLLVIGSLFFYVFVQPSEEVAVAPAVTKEAGVAAARNASLSPATAISIAVLPFANLSGDPGQDFFSDGMTEEISSALAKIPDLRVVARSSAFQFKGKNEDARAMGQTLGATHLIEGSVRKAGNRVRISAELIKADDGLRVWAENYDRDLTDVFEIQENIARAIAASLRMPLGLNPGNNLVNSRSIDPETYEQYLRAKALYRARGLKNVDNTIALAEKVVAHNPSYAPGWALLSSAHMTRPNYSAAAGNAVGITVDDLRREVQTSGENAEPAARRALQLDPDLADGYLSLAGIQGKAGKFLAAEELHLKALALDPNNPEALNGYGAMLAELGYAKKALTLRQQAHALEPFIPQNNRNLGIVLWLNGQDDAAIATLKGTNLANATQVIARIHAGAGRFKDAADTLLSAPSGTFPPDALKEAVRLLGIAPKKVEVAANPNFGAALNFVYLFVGAPERVLDYYERNVEAGWMTNAATSFLWSASYAPARKTERFKVLARKAGMVEYWRAKGWPDFCHPTTGDDFVCN